jgi:capsular polysaccharide biosynthesis protein
MSLLLIARKIWRYKLATLPILAIVLIGSFYVIAVKEPVYEAASTYILVNPPPPPTEDEVLRNPKLGVGTDNPYTRYSDQSVVVQVLASRLSSDAARGQLAKQGADPSYIVAPSSEFGFTAPIVEITGTGSSPEAAIRTANVIGLAVTHELDRMQKARGVAEKYRIDTQQVVAPNRAKLKASGQLRSLVAVFALGAILLFAGVSVADALVSLRKERVEHRLHGGIGQDSGVGAALEPVPSLDPDRAERAPARDAWPEAGANGDSAGEGAVVRPASRPRQRSRGR